MLDFHQARAELCAQARTTSIQTEPIVQCAQRYLAQDIRAQYDAPLFTNSAMDGYALHQQCKLEGYTLVPLSLYFKHGRVKMELGLCKGKKLYDKRADAAKRDAKRSIDRAVKSNGVYY